MPFSSGVRKIKYIGIPVGNDNIAMCTTGCIFRTGRRFIEDRERLLFPVLQVRGTVHPHTRPLIGNQPEIAFEFKNYRPLTATERAELDRLVADLGNSFCRRCGYCAPCSVGIDIPQVFIFHLQYTRYNIKDKTPAKYNALPVKASACTQCGLCETRCPYDLPIRERMKQVAADLG